MTRLRSALSALVVAALAAVAVQLPGGLAEAAPKCRSPKCADTLPPTVAVTGPATGQSVSGTVTVTGTSSDNAAVSAVSVSVDGGGWTPVSGLSAWSWSWATMAVGNGTHSIAARAVDTSGNASTSTVLVSVANPVPDTTPPTVVVGAPAHGATVAGTVTVSGTASDNASLTKVEVQVDGGSWTVASGTSSWSWSWATPTVANGTHSLTARATDSAGNTSTATRSVTVSNQAQAPSVWTSPEGVKIDIQTTAGGWTHEEIHALLTQNARDLSRIGPGLTVVVQDKKPTLTAVAAGGVNDLYTSVSATIQLDARSTSSFSVRPDDILTHEFGHVWVNYHVYLNWQGDWSAYLSKRWTTSDGSVTLATDSRTGSSYVWTPDEIAADDYRLLFGSTAAISQRNASLNQQIPDPRNQSGLRDWFLTTLAD